MLSIFEYLIILDKIINNNIVDIMSRAQKISTHDETGEFSAQALHTARSKLNSVKRKNMLLICLVVVAAFAAIMMFLKYQTASNNLQL